MSSTGVVAIFIPVVLSIGERMRLPPGRLMVPLCFAGLISGMLTLVATGLVKAGHYKRRRRREFLDFMNGVIDPIAPQQRTHQR
jgi:di/tricarboxylate transporter